MVNQLASATHQALGVPDLSDKITRLSNRSCEGGAFSDIYKCHYNSHDGRKEVAVKAFRFTFSIESQRNGKDKINKMIRREIGIWKRVDHPNIVPFLGFTYGFGREGSVSLVSLWMPNGTLHALLEKHNNHLTDAHRLQLLLDVSNGVRYLHTFSLTGLGYQPIIHGDLKCNNVLLDDSYTARLVDFGFASVSRDTPETLDYLQWASRRPGAIRWAAPEHFMVEDIECTTGSDIYSLGNMIFRVLSGKLPWSEVRQDNAVMLLLSKGYKPPRPDSRPIGDAQWALIEQCWASVNQRPAVEDVVLSLQGFLHSCLASQPLGDFLCRVQPVLSDVSSSSITTSGFSSDENIMFGSTNLELWRGLADPDDPTSDLEWRQHEVRRDITNDVGCRSGTQPSATRNDTVPPLHICQVEAAVSAPDPDHSLHAVITPSSPDAMSGSLDCEEGISGGFDYEMHAGTQPPLSTVVSTLENPPPRELSFTHPTAASFTLETESTACITISGTSHPGSLRLFANESKPIISDGDHPLASDPTSLSQLRGVGLTANQPTIFDTWNIWIRGMLSWLVGCFNKVFKAVNDILSHKLRRPLPQTNRQIPGDLPL